MTRIAFIVVEAAFLAIAHLEGGPPWTLVAAGAFLALSWVPASGSVIGLAAGSLLWLAVFRATGDREYFFPYALQLATLVACRLSDRGRGWGLAGGAAVVLVFLGIRVAQRATVPVLAVEAAVGTAILAAALFLRQRGPAGPLASAAIVAASAALACLGLLL
ncbi:MAG: hypothetical protein ACKOTB_00400 [Planctomycetia bacterium]